MRFLLRRRSVILPRRRIRKIPKISNYDIKVSYGTLTVLKQSLKVESASEAFEYDNVEYSKTDDYSTEGLVGTHKLNIDETTATKVKDVTSGVSKSTFNS